jgi:hypothetical protein
MALRVGFSQPATSYGGDGGVVPSKIKFSLLLVHLPRDVEEGEEFSGDVSFEVVVRVMTLWFYQLSTCLGSLLSFPVGVVWLVLDLLQRLLASTEGLLMVASTTFSCLCHGLKV